MDDVVCVASNLFVKSAHLIEIEQRRVRYVVSRTSCRRRSLALHRQQFELEIAEEWPALRGVIPSGSREKDGNSPDGAAVRLQANAVVVFRRVRIGDLSRCQLLRKRSLAARLKPDHLVQFVAKLRVISR